MMDKRNRNSNAFLWVTLITTCGMSLFALAMGEILGELDSLATVAAAIIEFAGFLLVMYQLKRDDRLNSSQFIFEFNSNFISDKDLAMVEWELERSADGFGELQIDYGNPDYQNFVNYLVFHEGFAAVVKQGVISFEEFDNLLSYRFFICMNNPDVQRILICPYAEYYQGCFWLYKHWYEYKKRNGLPIPCEETSLSLCQEYRRMFG